MVKWFSGEQDELLLLPASAATLDEAWQDERFWLSEVMGERPSSSSEAWLELIGGMDGQEVGEGTRVGPRPLADWKGAQ